MKKKVLVIAAVFILIGAAVFSLPADNFSAGRMYFGGSGIVWLDMEGAYDMSIELYPDVGYFAADNLLLEVGVDLAFQGSGSYMALTTGVDYYVPLAGVLAPYAGTVLYYCINDDFSTRENTLWIRVLAGIDIFFAENAAFFTQLLSPVFYLDGGTPSSWLGIDFGFHFYVSSGLMGLSNK